MSDYKVRYVIDDVGEPLTDEQRRKCQEWFEKSFADRLTKDVGMILQQPPFEGNTASTAAVYPQESLTAEKLIQMMEEMRRTMPPPVCVDLYGHELGDQAYELNRKSGERRFIVVPKKVLERTYHELRDVGVDVRLEPRYGLGEEPIEPIKVGHE